MLPLWDLLSRIERSGDSGHVPAQYLKDFATHRLSRKKMNAAIRTLVRGVGATATRKTTTSSSTLRPLSSVAEAASQTATPTPGLPDSIARVGGPLAFPNEYPGQNYVFNWCLNADGVTPLNKSAFRIIKPLDLRVAGLTLPKISPLRVNVSAEKATIPEAGGDKLDFDTFDDRLQATKDALSLSPSLYCPEGYAPNTRTGVRIITNAGASLAPDLVAYLDRAPKREPKSMAITCYVLSSADVKDEFTGYAIEEVEERKEDGSKLAVSVATVVVTGSPASLKKVVAGIELCVEGLEADAKERSEKKAAEEKAKAAAA